jgi:putative membrane protein
MNVSIKSSHALRFAALLLVILLGYLLFIRPDRLTGKVVSSPMLSLTPAVSYMDAAPAPLARTEVRNTGLSLAPLARADVRNTGLSDADRSFFERAVKSGGQEDIVSRGALSHLVYPNVREYAYMVLNDHTTANVELMALAARKGVVLPAPEKLTYSKWWKGAGSVDQLYVNLMAEDNEAVVELFEKATKSDDAEVATFARNTLPILQNHLNTARDLKKVTD